MKSIKSYFKQIEQAQRFHLSDHSPIVIRLDGKDVTKNHKKYPLMRKNGFTESIMNAAKEITKDCNCIYFAMLDEVNIIFHDPVQFIEREADDDQMYGAVMFLQCFLDKVKCAYPEVRFNISVFNIKAGTEQKYITYRREFCKVASIVYVAKEYLEKEEYSHRDVRAVLQVLREKHLPNPIDNPELHWFFYGILLSPI